MMNKRIVIVSSEFPPQPGGIGEHAYQLANALHNEEFNILVLTDQRSEDGKEEEAFDEKLPFTILRIKRRRFRLLMYFNRITELLKTLCPADTVIATGKFSLWNVAASTLNSSIHSIAVIHGTEVNLKSWFQRTLTNKALLRFNRIVAVSEYTKSLISHLDREILVIHNGINPDYWNCNGGKKNIQLKGEPALITVGRLSERKGQLRVIKHLPKLLKVFPGLHYHCVGIDILKDKYLEVAKNLEVEKHVSFHGLISSSHLPAYLCASDLFIMLSMEDKAGDVEGFGIAVLEANAAGIPALGSKNCGLEDAILDGKSGILVDNDSQDLSNAISSILKDYQRYKNESRQWAILHDWERIGEQYIQLLK